MASTSTICRCESALKVSTRWPGLRRVFRGGKDGYSTQLTWPLSSAERVFSFENPGSVTGISPTPRRRMMGSRQ